MERSAPAAEAGEDHLHKGQDRRDDRDGADPLDRVPGEQRHDQKQQRSGQRQEEPKRAMGIERLGVRDALSRSLVAVVGMLDVVQTEDPLTCQEDLDDDRNDVERRKPLQN